MIAKHVHSIAEELFWVEHLGKVGVNKTIFDVSQILVIFNITKTNSFLMQICVPAFVPKNQSLLLLLSENNIAIQTQTGDLNISFWKTKKRIFIKCSNFISPSDQQ